MSEESETAWRYRGRAWVFGDHINTDLILPSETMYGKVPEEEIKRFVFRAIRPEFAEHVKPGDLVVAGVNFGCGSSRPAARVLKELGVACVLAESFSRLFFRNAINLGYPVLVCTGITKAVRDGDELEVEPLIGRVRNLTTGEELQAEPLPPFVRQLMKAGGLLELLRRGERLRT